MSKAKFTKGPWGWEYDESTSSIIQVFSEAEEAKGDPNICRMQHEPDANLISAAPEMYELLNSIENDDGQIPTFLWDKIQSVLAKARGDN